MSEVIISPGPPPIVVSVKYLAGGALVAVALVGGALLVKPAKAATGITGVLVPLYTSPTDASWDTLIGIAGSSSAVPIIATINPANGPGSASEASYVSGIQKLQASGIVVLGYVNTGDGSVAQATVEGQIADYSTWYGCDGVWFDNMASATGYESYYLALTNYAKSLGMSVTIGNPGDNSVSPTYIGTVTLINAYEGPGLPAPSYFAALLAAAGSPQDFTFVAYDVATEPTTLSQYTPYVSFIGLSSLTTPNPYSGIPPYLSSVVAELQAANTAV
jgi:Spherulation-specific family 4